MYLTDSSTTISEFLSIMNRIKDIEHWTNGTAWLGKIDGFIAGRETVNTNKTEPNKETMYAHTKHFDFRLEQTEKWIKQSQLKRYS